MRLECALGSVSSEHEMRRTATKHVESSHSGIRPKPRRTALGVGREPTGHSRRDARFGRASNCGVSEADRETRVA
ncbi:hypothetical protein CP557_16890 [Natrinema ejinorense]|uniref:Uncharacterized protein n=1 Tax=Natrinema ejinorense TaxID=373386 RepID=A0A2A5QZ61_9EURY|nr:hypothetical protein CP557_16890 [Natrinema ejinorense]